MQRVVVKKRRKDSRDKRKMYKREKGGRHTSKLLSTFEVFTEEVEAKMQSAYKRWEDKAMGKTCSHFSYSSLIFTAIQDCCRRQILYLKHTIVSILTKTFFYKVIYGVRDRKSSFAIKTDAL